MRRAGGVGGLAVLLVVAVWLFSSFAGEPSPLCMRGGRGATARQALDRYYRGCVGRATVTNGPYDGQKEDTRYATFSRVVEFTVDRRGMTRFLLVGKEHPDDEWAVLDGEGSGP